MIAACGPNSSEEDAVKSFHVKGYVENVLDKNDRLMVDHEEMPGYMPPMIMLFNVADPQSAVGLEPGQQIRFVYKVTNQRSWIEDIEPTGEKRDPRASVTSRSDSFGELLEIGDPLPDYAFLDEEGQPIALSDYRGSVIAISFIFTRCPVPEYCPMMMRNFGNVDEILADGPVLEAPWRLVTISFDPENDTPEVLKRYGKAFDYDPAHWDLLTSKTMDPINGIAANVGLRFGKRDNSYLHNLRTVVLDTEGRIAHIFTDENWAPEELAEQMKSAAASH